MRHQDSCSVSNKYYIASYRYRLTCSKWGVRVLVMMCIRMNLDQRSDVKNLKGIDDMRNDRDVVKSKAEQSRSNLLDICKGVAILLVVLGHNIQYGSGVDFLNSGAYLVHPVFKFIYSFHMPLFTLISGYLCHIKDNDDIKKFVYRKIRGLFIPVFSWVILEFILRALIGLQDINTLMQFIVDFSRKLVYSYWYLWAILWCSIAVWIFEKYLNGNRILIIFLIIISMLIPNKINSHLYIFVFPYYLVGYLWQRRLSKKSFSARHLKILFFLDTVLFVLLLPMYNYNSYIYTTQIYLFGDLGWLNQLSINVYRWLIGFAGAIFVILILCFLKKIMWKSVKKFLIVLGKNTLGIYIISTFINIYGYKIMYKIIGKHIKPNAFVWISESITCILICLFTCHIIKKQRILNMILLGGR